MPSASSDPASKALLRAGSRRGNWDYGSTRWKDCCSDPTHIRKVNLHRQGCQRTPPCLGSASPEPSDYSSQQPAPGRDRAMECPTPVLLLPQSPTTTTTHTLRSGQPCQISAHTDPAQVTRKPAQACFRSASVLVLLPTLVAS